MLTVIILISINATTASLIHRMNLLHYVFKDCNVTPFCLLCLYTFNHYNFQMAVYLIYIYIVNCYTSFLSVINVTIEKIVNVPNIIGINI